MKKNTAVGLFLGGALVGAGLALLFAPAPGTETRKKVGNWFELLGEKLRAAFEKSRVEAGHKKDQLAAALKAGKDAYSTYENGKSREKIAA